MRFVVLWAVWGLVQSFDSVSESVSELWLATLRDLRRYPVDVKDAGILALCYCAITSQYSLYQCIEVWFGYI